MRDHRSIVLFLFLFGLKYGATKQANKQANAFVEDFVLLFFVRRGLMVFVASGAGDSVKAGLLAHWI